MSWNTHPLRAHSQHLPAEANPRRWYRTTKTMQETRRIGKTHRFAIRARGFVVPGFFLSAPGGGPVYESTLFSRLTLHSVWMPWPGVEPVESAVTPLLLPCRFVSLSLLMALLCRVFPTRQGLSRQFIHRTRADASQRELSSLLKHCPFYVRSKTKKFNAISATIVTMSSTFHHISRI